MVENLSIVKDNDPWRLNFPAVYQDIHELKSFRDKAVHCYGHRFILINWLVAWENIQANVPALEIALDEAIAVLANDR